MDALDPEVLVVEDSQEAAALIERALAGTVRLRSAPSLAAARAEIDARRPDLILLDVSLPDGEGFELCSQIRSAGATGDVPVLFLTARHETSDKLAAFSLGADDYLPKPFHPLELRARVLALLRRARGEAGSGGKLRLGRLEIDLPSLRVTVTGADGPASVTLTAHEFRLLRHLALHEDRVFTRSELVAAAWEGTVVSPRTVDSHVSNLRRKLGPCGHYLEAVRGVGYRLRALPPGGSGIFDGGFSTEDGPAVEDR